MTEDEITARRPTRRRTLQAIAGAGLLAVGGFTGTTMAAPGDQQWVFETGAWVSSSPAVADGIVYVGSGDNSVYALNIDSGEEIWTYNTDREVYSSPAVGDDGTVYVGSRDGSVYALIEQ